MWFNKCLRIPDGSPAWNEYSDKYEGNSESKFIVDAEFAGMYYLGRNWFVGGRAGVNNSSDFREVTAGLVLRYSFGKGHSLCRPDKTVDDMMFSLYRY